MRLNDTTRPYQGEHHHTDPGEAFTAAQTRRARDLFVIENGQGTYDSLVFGDSKPKHRDNTYNAMAFNVIRGGCQKHHWTGVTA